MKNWKKQKTDDLSKTERIRKIKAEEKSFNRSKKTNFELAISAWDDKLQIGFFTARVVEVHKRYVFVSSEPSPLKVNTNDVWLGRIARTHTQTFRKERNFFSVGDVVLCRPGSEDGTPPSGDLPACIIVHRAPRHNQITRKDPLVRQRDHVIASNISQLVVVASFLNPKIKWGLIDRYLVVAEEQRIPAQIILNKEDLLISQQKAFLDECNQRTNTYSQLGYSVTTLCADRPSKRDKANLKQLFSGKISVVCGHSGVGKSSIVNLLNPEICQDVENEEILTKGRHTTSYASFIRLKHGGYCIDTPGIRSLLLHEHQHGALTWCFVEMRPYIGKCKYRECQHLSEPGCAIIEAVKSGDITTWRYRSYVAILTGASGREGRICDL